MRDIKITIPAGQSAHQEVAMRAWLVRAISADDVVRLEAQEQGSLLLHAGQEVDLDSVVAGFDLVNKSDVDVELHLQVAGKASLGSKKNGADSGGATEHIDQVARDAAAVAVEEADEAELLALDNAQAIAELQNQAPAESVQPTFQVLKDSGRLTDQDETHIVSMGAAGFDGRSSSIPTNRLVEVESFKFAHNNASGGGTGIVLDPLVVDLLAAMGRFSGSALRYGTEFYVAKRRFLANPGAGSEVTKGGVTYFLGSSSTHLLGPDKFATMAQWVWAENDGELLFVKRPAGRIWIDEVEHNENTLLTAGWHHVCATDTSALGYASAMCRVNGIPNAFIAHALPVVSRNNKQILKHSAPLIFN